MTSSTPALHSQNSISSQFGYGGGRGVNGGGGVNGNVGVNRHSIAVHMNEVTNGATNSL